jgi:hypothetical protein
MSERKKTVIILQCAVLLGVFLVILDFVNARRGHENTLVGVVDAQNAGKNVVVVVPSNDKALSSPVPLDAEKVTYAQVDAAVRRALDLDVSDTNIRKVITPADWVIVKLNLVRAPLADADGKRRLDAFWLNGNGKWGDESDPRVVKSVVSYLVEKVGPKRITLVEGAAEWGAAGKQGQGPQYEKSYDVDGWTTRWEGEDNLCYKEICEQLTKSQNHTVVDYIDLNEDKYTFAPLPNGAYQREKVQTRRANRYGYGALVPGTGTLRTGYYMPQTMLGPNKLINIPAMKMNVGGGTLVFKNYVGAFASIPYGDGLQKSQMDRYGYAQGMLDVFSYKPTVYAVVAGFWASEKDWPNGTQNLHHNVVIAGGNPVAVEATTLRIMGVNPAEVPQMHLARSKGYGSWEEKDITVVGAPVRSVRRNFIKHSSYNGIGFQNYLINGPWKETDLDKDLLGGEATIHPQDGDSTNGKPWWVFKHSFGFPEAYVSLDETVGGDFANTITYGYLRLQSPSRQEGKFTFGFDDGAKVYLNGKVIFQDDGPKDFTIRSVSVPVVLEKGENHLLIKLKNRFGPAGFASSIEDTSKTMLYDLDVVIPKERGMAAPGKG